MDDLLSAEVHALMEHNRQVLAEGGPRLSYAYKKFVVARDEAGLLVLVGGLGACGVGRMWLPAEGHEQLPGFAEAPKVSASASEGGLARENMEAEARAVREMREAAN